MSYCSRCGREAETLAGPDGAMYCNDCLVQATSQRCIDCTKCYQRRCGDAIYACPFCHGSPEGALERFEQQLKEERVAQPLRIEEKCERCGGTTGCAFILNGKALAGIACSTSRTSGKSSQPSPATGSRLS